MSEKRKITVTMRPMEVEVGPDWTSAQVFDAIRDEIWEEACRLRQPGLANPERWPKWATGMGGAAVDHLAEHWKKAPPESEELTPEKFKELVQEGQELRRAFEKRLRTPPKPPIQRFVELRIRSILACPDGWGPPHAVELQIELLVEVALAAKGKSASEIDGVHGRFVRFVGARFPGPCFALAPRLGLTDRASEEFTQTLRDFVVQELGDIFEGV